MKLLFRNNFCSVDQEREASNLIPEFTSGHSSTIVTIEKSRFGWVKPLKILFLVYNEQKLSM